MVMDGLPAGATQLERYQWQALHMTNALAAKLASRITQLFGRINRGTRDYSVHIVVGRALNTWLSNDRNLALLSPLMRSQIQLGHALHRSSSRSMTPMVLYPSSTKSLDAMENGWKFTAQKSRIRISTPWNGFDLRLLRKRWWPQPKQRSGLQSIAGKGRLIRRGVALEEVAASVARGEGRVAGWFNLWVGYCYEIAGDIASAQLAYQLARQKLGSNLPLPQGRTTGAGFELNTMFQKKLGSMLLATQETFSRYEGLFLQGVLVPFTSGGSSAFVLEEALRQLGESMGYDASRPDNEGLGGPDVLWVDASSKSSDWF